MSDAFTLQGSVEVDVNSVIKDLEKLGYTVDGVGKKTKSLSDKMASVGKGMATFGSNMTKMVTLPILGAGAASFSFASDMEESLNKVNVACGDGAEEVLKFGETTLKSFGIAKGTAYDMMSTWSDMGTGMTLSQQKANDMSKSLLGLAGDLASFKNVRVDVAQTALTGIYTGETESLKQLGIVMTQANLNEFARAKGITKTIDKMSQAEQVELRYQYVMEKTKNAQGDFARTSDGAANQIRIFQESLKELAGTIGQNLLPILTPIIQKINDMVQKFGAMDEDTQKLILGIGFFVAALGPAILAIGKVISTISNIAKAYIAAKKAIVAFNATQKLATAGTKLMAAAQKALNFIMGLNPILLVVIAITALIGILIYLWNTSEGFRNFVTDMWAKITSIFQEFDAFLTGIFQTDFTLAFGAFGNVLNAFFQNVENIWNGIKQIFSGIIDFVAGLFTQDWERCWNGVLNIFGGIFNLLYGVAKAPINAIIGLLNFAIDGINSLLSFDFPGFVNELGIPDISMSIPKINYLYTGGIVTSPTLFGGNTVVGDAYKGKGSQAEAVVPLDKLIAWIESIANRPIVLQTPDGKVLMRYLAQYQDEFNKYNKMKFV